MTTLHETAYPRLKPDPTAKELQEIYTPTEAERLCVAAIATGSATRLALLLHLKLFQNLRRHLNQGTQHRPNLTRLTHLLSASRPHLSTTSSHSTRPCCCLGP